MEAWETKTVKEVLDYHHFMIKDYSDLKREVLYQLESNYAVDHLNLDTQLVSTESRSDSHLERSKTACNQQNERKPTSDRYSPPRDS